MDMIRYDDDDDGDDDIFSIEISHFVTAATCRKFILLDLADETSRATQFQSRVMTSVLTISTLVSRAQRFWY